METSKNLAVFKIDGGDTKYSFVPRHRDSFEDMEASKTDEQRDKDQPRLVEVSLNFAVSSC